MIHELTMPPTDYFENQITLQRIQNVVHTNVPHKNQMYFIMQMGSLKRIVQMLSIFKTEFITEREDLERSIILELTAQSYNITYKEASFTLYSAPIVFDEGQFCPQGTSGNLWRCFWSKPGVRTTVLLGPSR